MCFGLVQLNFINLCCRTMALHLSVSYVRNMARMSVWFHWLKIANQMQCLLKLSSKLFPQIPKSHFICLGERVRSVSESLWTILNFACTFRKLLVILISCCCWLTHLEFKNKLLQIFTVWYLDHNPITYGFTASLMLSPSQVYLLIMWFLICNTNHSESLNSWKFRVDFEVFHFQCS